MGDRYHSLPGGPGTLDPIQKEESLLNKKVFNIKVKDHFVFFGCIFLFTVLNAVFRSYLY